MHYTIASIFWHIDLERNKWKTNTILGNNWGIYLEKYGVFSIHYLLQQKKYSYANILCMKLLKEENKNRYIFFSLTDILKDL